MGDAGIQIFVSKGAETMPQVKRHRPGLGGEFHPPLPSPVRFGKGGGQ